MKLYRLDRNRPILFSQVAIIESRGKILLLKDVMHKKYWMLPGGLLEITESLPNGLRREIWEETRLRVKPKSIVGVYDRWHKNWLLHTGRRMDVRVIKVVYVCTKISGKVRLSDEHEDFQWVTRSVVRKLPLYDIPRSALRDYFHTNL